MDLQDFLRTLTILDIFRINGYGVYGLIGAGLGCAVQPPPSFREFFVRMSCGFIFSFTLTPLSGPLLGGIVEQNLGPRAAEHLYDSPPGIGILVGMLSYFLASFVLSVAKHSKEDVEKNRTTFHDVRKRNQQPDACNPPQPPPPDLQPPNPPPKPSPDTTWPDPNSQPHDIWSLQGFPDDGN